eukprot:21339-Heterococcus_DN1.PRE.3
MRGTRWSGRREHIEQENNEHGGATVIYSVRGFCFHAMQQQQYMSNFAHVLLPKTLSAAKTGVLLSSVALGFILAQSEFAVNSGKTKSDRNAKSKIRHCNPQDDDNTYMVDRCQQCSPGSLYVHQQ